MLTNNDIAVVYHTILCSPGMNDIVKIDLRITRKNVLLLSSVLERGLAIKEADKALVNLLNVVPKETMQELSAISEDFLHKAGLKELSDKLNELGTTK